MEKNLFGSVDYGVFAVMLLLSALIGVYFAFFAKQKQNTTSEYLLGGKKMGIFPISMSLISSFISGIAILGMPAEVYIYGAQIWTTVLSMVFVSAAVAWIYMPVFYKLHVTSSYGYLKLRFNEPVRLFGSMMFLFKMLLYIPIVIYVPALAFSQVTGLQLHLVTPIVCCVCIFYTSLGGLKAVVWTDTLQTFLMIGGAVVVMILGINRTGGVSAVLEISERGDRLELFNMNPDPTIRHTFWTVTFGSFFNYLAVCTVNQGMVQRCLAMPQLHKAKITVMILAVGVILIMSLSCFTGLVAYSYYSNCDPVTTKSIQKADQLLPYFVMEIAESIPGLPGLFVAGVFSAALSSMSTGLNSMTGVIFQDLIRPVLKRPLSEGRSSLYMKLTTAALGVLCTGLVFLVEHLGTILQAVHSLMGVVSGPMLGVFTLGVLFPWANSRGAAAGGVTSFLVLAWMSFGAQYHISQGLIKLPKKSLSVSGCSEMFPNITLPLNATQLSEPSNVFPLYKLSYMYYTTSGVAITLVVGMAVSYLTGMNDVRAMDPDVLSPVIHRFLPPRADSPKELVALGTIYPDTLGHAHMQSGQKGRYDETASDKDNGVVADEDAANELTKLKDT